MLIPNCSSVFNDLVFSQSPMNKVPVPSIELCFAKVQMMIVTLIERTVRAVRQLNKTPTRHPERQFVYFACQVNIL